MCGFSASATNTLNELLPEYHTVNVLEDPEIREGIKQYGEWPTIPQLYVGGELVGGADIVGVPLRLGETNTASRGGKAGVSDSFASALWAVVVIGRWVVSRTWRWRGARC